MSPLAILVLAAGKGERMKSGLPKVLHAIGGRPLLGRVLRTAFSLKPRKTVVLVGHQADQVKTSLGDVPVIWALQREQLGTAHAVLCGLEALGHFHGDLMVLYGDVPLLKKETLQCLRKCLDKNKAALAFLTTRFKDPTGYGRVIRDAAGRLVKIVEEKEASLEQKKIREVNCGIYLMKLKEVRAALQRVRKSIVKGEYYLTDLVEELLADRKIVIAVPVEHSEETLGVNNRIDLARADAILQKRIRQRWLEAGVTMNHPESIRIEEDVLLDSDVVLHPGVVLTGQTRIGSGTEILPYSVIEDSRVGQGARIGPMAHLRPASVVEDGAHVGNFVELKKARLGRKAKANHLSYLGDAVIGAGANVGAGTITCNYDGKNKFRTVIGEGAFIGSDTQLVAPVSVGRHAYVASGTTVTKDVPAEALAISRVDQKNIRGWVRKRSE